jgi:hypothetical protein
MTVVHKTTMILVSPVVSFRTASSWPVLSWASMNAYKVIARFTMSILPWPVRSWSLCRSALTLGIKATVIRSAVG